MENMSSNRCANKNKNKQQREIKTNENSPARLIKIKINNKEIKTNEDPAPQFVPAGLPRGLSIN
jgi:hypothetical protein